MGSRKQEVVACWVPNDGRRRTTAFVCWVVGVLFAMKTLFKVSFLSENEIVGMFGMPSSARKFNYRCGRVQGASGGGGDDG